VSRRSSQLKVRSRRDPVRWELCEHAAVKLWCEVWGGRAMLAPARENVDAFWTDGRLVIGTLEVKDHSFRRDGRNEEADHRKFTILPVRKYLAAVAFDALAVSSFLIVVLQEQTLWEHVLEAQRLEIWKQPEDEALAGRLPEPAQVVAVYPLKAMHRLTNEPLFTERDPGGRTYVTPA